MHEVFGANHLLFGTSDPPYTGRYILTLTVICAEGTKNVSDGLGKSHVPMIGRSKTNNDPYQHREEEEEEVIDRQKYLTAVGSFTSNYTYQAGHCICN